MADNIELALMRNYLIYHVLLFEKNKDSAKSRWFTVHCRFADSTIDYVLNKTKYRVFYSELHKSYRICFNAESVHQATTDVRGNRNDYEEVSRQLYLRLTEGDI